MKRWIVTWWDGEALVSAQTAEDAKELIRGTHSGYRNSGRNAPLFAEEVK